MTQEIKQRIEQIRRGEVPEGYIVENHQMRPLEWKYEKIGKHLVVHDEYSNDTEQYMLATSSRQGLLPQTDYYNDQRFDETASGFHVVPEGYITYRHMSDDDTFRFNVNNLGAPVLVSPEYPVFTTTVKLNQRLLIEYLNGTNEFRAFCRAQKKGSTRTRMYFNRLREFMMPIPPVPEQQKIADILATCDRVIELKQKLVDELKKLKKGCLEKMFPQKGNSVPEIRFPGFTTPWRRNKLGEITDSFSGGTPTVGKSEYYGGSIPFIRSAEINSDTTELFLTEEGLRNSSAKMVKKGDILYALYGATSGEVGVAKIDGAINQAILDIKPHERFDSHYIMQWLRKSKESIVETYLQGGQGNLSGTIVTSLMIDCPEYNEQKRIGAFFTNLDDLITLHQRGMEAEQLKKKALMQLLLTGIARTI